MGLALVCWSPKVLLVALEETLRSSGPTPLGITKVPSSRSRSPSTPERQAGHPLLRTGPRRLLVGFYTDPGWTVSRDLPRIILKLATRKVEALPCSLLHLRGTTAIPWP